MESNTKKRWLSVYVENEVGVLARVAGLFSGKLYNLNSLTVGETEKADTSRMTISVVSDDRTFEQVKHQLGNMVEVIEVMDYTEKDFFSKEVMYIKVWENGSCSDALSVLERDYSFSVIDRSEDQLIIESVAKESINNQFLKDLKPLFSERIEIVRGGSAAISGITPMDQGGTSETDTHQYYECSQEADH
ncbi:acetolactate synthase small subunit [Enterococcus florum]|uniref:Acetolactate synthase small subunit n=1 Tax=Enterococcus florum TaxID=2480627 RepID=A0A4P5PA08_9ENTE|nr:acetolactate synthase small subunit [Enterococcus florum]GCF93194.1 acetolactate synthase small subunit [Enterococcus florum]